MTFKEYFQLIIEGEKGDWQHIGCWGAGAGGSFKDSFAVWMTGDGQMSRIDVNSHSAVLAFKPNLSVSIAYGMLSNEDFVEDWANKFPDPHASSSLVDFFYNDNLIHRETYVAVDGGRAYIPLPSLRFKPETYEVESITVAKCRNDFYRLLNSLISVTDYDSYVNRAGITVIDAEWPA